MIYIVIQQYIDINLKLIYSITAIEKPHNNTVYVFEYCYFLKMVTGGSRNM
jgi:hypothetical protein